MAIQQRSYSGLAGTSYTFQVECPNCGQPHNQSITLYEYHAKAGGNSRYGDGYFRSNPFNLFCPECRYKPIRRSRKREE